MRDCIIDPAIPLDRECCSKVMEAPEGVPFHYPHPDWATGQTILLVEDETFVREVTGEILRLAGYRVLTARDAAEAERAYADAGFKVTLLLTDVILPKQTGPMLATTLRRENARLKVLYVTGYADQIVVRSTGKEDCLAKPFSADVLLQRVHSLLGSSEICAQQQQFVTHACGDG